MVEQWARATAERVARESYGRLLAILASRTGDIAGAEDALAQALVSALEQWPRQGVPVSPEAWLVAVAKRRRADVWRRASTHQAASDHLRLIAEEGLDGDMDEWPERRLALMLACTASEIDPAARTPLMLQAVLGLTAAQIAGPFLSSPAAIGQRLSRAKVRLREAGVPFVVPEREELARRLPGVLDAIYAAFALEWGGASEPSVVDQPGALTSEAIWLGRVATAVLPSDPEAKGLLSLMLYIEARRSARRSHDGRFVPLECQNTSLWDTEMLAEADKILAAASQSGATGRYQIEAAIQSAHVVRLRFSVNTWPDIMALYDILLNFHSGPVVQLNRAMALAQINGPKAALSELTELEVDRRMASYQPYWAARAQLLQEVGQGDDASEALRVAAGLTVDPAVRAWLLDRIGAH